MGLGAGEREGRGGGAGGQSIWGHDPQGSKGRAGQQPEVMDRTATAPRGAGGGGLPGRACRGRACRGAAGAPGYAGAEWVWAGGAGGLTAGGRGHQVPASRVELAVQAHGSRKRVGVGGWGTEDAQRAAGTGRGPGCL